MPDDDKWVFSSSGHHMFVSFSVDIFVPSIFTAKIHQGKKSIIIKIFLSIASIRIYELVYSWFVDQ